MENVRLCREEESDAILAIINAGAKAYRGVIPPDRWHEPYMARAPFNGELAAGVVFWGYEDNRQLVGVMGIEPMGDVDLVRHAYVLPGSQQRGFGGLLLAHLRQLSTRRMLVGTWAAADWAIRFYQHHGFHMVSPERKDILLRTYWTIPDRQIETSVVLANPRFEEAR